MRYTRQLSDARWTRRWRYRDGANSLLESVGIVGMNMCSGGLASVLGTVNCDPLVLKSDATRGHGAGGAQLGVPQTERSVVLHRIGGGTVRTWYAVPGFLQICAYYCPLVARGVAGRLVSAPAGLGRLLTPARWMGPVGGRGITLGLRRTWEMSPRGVSDLVAGSCEAFWVALLA